MALAEEAHGHAIAAEARRIAQRFDACRVVVAIIAGPTELAAFVERALDHRIAPAQFPEARPLAIRYGRGVEHLLADASDAVTLVLDRPLLRDGARFLLGTSTTRWPPGRIDLVFVDHAGARGMQRGDCPRGVQTIAANLQQRDQLTCVLELIERTAHELGADRVEHQLAEHYRNLGRQLWCHLAEQQRALAVTDHDTRARVGALTMARALGEALFDSGAQSPDAERQALNAWLTAERAKFLMATKADAQLALDARMARMTVPRHELRYAATAAAQQIAVELLATFWQRLRSGSDAQLALQSRRILEALEQAVGDLVGTLPLDALARIAPVRGFRRDLDVPLSRSRLGSLVDRVRMTGRIKIEETSRQELVTMLETCALRLTTHVLDEYDERAMLFEQRFFELIDSSVESIHVAATLAAAAQTAGAESVVRARARIRTWSTRLGEIIERL